MEVICSECNKHATVALCDECLENERTDAEALAEFPCHNCNKESDVHYCEQCDSNNK